jgi:hypothetical protein
VFCGEDSCTLAFSFNLVVSLHCNAVDIAMTTVAIAIIQDATAVTTVDECMVRVYFF